MHPAPFTLGFLFMTAVASASAPLRVACVGDSITYGDQIADRARDSYPAVLERIGEGHFVTGNFGVNGATALDIPYRAWTGTRAFREALAFSPDAVVIMLGINDLAFSGLHDRYPDRLRDLVWRFQSLDPQPLVLLCTLTPIAPLEHQAHANRLIRDTMNPAIHAVAAQTGAHLVDISAVFPNRLDLLPDGLHPNPAGAEIIARTVLDAIAAARSPSRPVQPAPQTGPPRLSIRNEALNACHRAERWLQSNPAPANLLDPAAEWTDRGVPTLDDLTDLLPLLAGEMTNLPPDPGLAFATLAIALDHIGQETVFLAPDRPVAWREALAHQLVQHQRIDASGGGYWLPAGPDAFPALIAETTAYALRALAVALGE